MQVYIINIKTPQHYILYDLFIIMHLYRLCAVNAQRRAYNVYVIDINKYVTPIQQYNNNNKVIRLL